MSKAEIISKCIIAMNGGISDTVSIVVKGSWSNRGYKKLVGVKGEQVAEYDDGVLCAFNAKELLSALNVSIKQK